MNKRSILLITNSKDIHACAVHCALNLMGAKPVLINTAQIPNGEPMGFQFSGGRTTFQLGEFEGSPEDIQSVWLRRISKRFLLPEASDPADATHIRDNCRASLLGLLRVLDDRFPVNPLASKSIHSLKAMQLKAAQDAGLAIPKTLVSNDFRAISEFHRATRRVCVKSYYAQGWKSDEGNVHSVTTLLENLDDFDRESFEIMPHIYQEFIDKKAEHRLTIFGDYAASIRIDMQALKGQSKVDWRSDFSYLSHIRPSSLPEAVVVAAKKIMKRCGLRFGTFDIAEAPEGEFVFFEVNESGQWLWTETACPEIRLLQPFCDFLIAADDEFKAASVPQPGDLRAEAIFSIVENDPRYDPILSAEFPDSAEYVADERVAAE